jgi:transcriptional regulator with PAS, ATPase and Fis domain
MTLAEKVAPTSLAVLILGECGVGKDVLAQAIHRRSLRADKPFVAINCAAIPDALVASELFGYEKGAFSGAAPAGKMGIFESANGGTVFLDEIGDMPLPMQATLLRVLENRELRPVGAIRSRVIDVRFITATNKDLEEAVARGTFRRDLLHRLNTMTITVPPLRDRADEIPGLAQVFVEAVWRESGRPGAPRLAPRLTDWLVRQPWPGNIRELKNLIECAAALSDGPEIGIADLPICDLSQAIDEVERKDPEVSASPFRTLDAKQSAERQRMVAALSACNGNQTRAAEAMGMPRRTFVSKLDLYGIPRPQKGFRARRREMNAQESSAASDQKLGPGGRGRATRREARPKGRGALFVVPRSVAPEAFEPAMSTS